MIEIPEASHLAHQLEQRCAGKRIATVVAGASPHKFAWYYGDRAREEGRVVEIREATA